MMICFKNVSFAYKKGETIIDSLDVDFNPGLTLLLGPNGCGKSTLLKIAAGVEIPDAGLVTVDGCDLWQKEVVARKGLTYLPEQPDLTPYATINEIIYLVCRLRGKPLDDGIKSLEFLGLQDLAHRTVRELSMGQRRRAVFAACLIGQPTHLLLDEPLEGMDRAIQKSILTWVEEHVLAGVTVVVVSHFIEPFVRLASRAVTIKHGKAFCYQNLPESDEKKKISLGKIAEGELLGETQ
jgi:ABC-type multidrug transport system ATPase subunit